MSGTLTAQDQAEVAAEIAGRVVATPVERGSRVGANGDLVRIAAAEVDAQAREAQANAAQIEARLGIAGGATFDVARVPEVASAEAARHLARTDFERAQTLHTSKLISHAEFEQKSAQLESAERQYDVARNGAEQQYQALMGAQARVTVAQKALADTVVRAPFAGVVGERFVSVGDYVTRGTKVASVMRVDSLRVELTVPEQYVAAVETGPRGDLRSRRLSRRDLHRAGALRLAVAERRHPRADHRGGGAQRRRPAQARLLRHGADRAGQDGARPAGAGAAVRTVAGTARVFVVAGDRVEERIVMIGQVVDDRVEITDGLKAGERVVARGVEQLVDGVRVAVR